MLGVGSERAVDFPRSFSDLKVQAIVVWPELDDNMVADEDSHGAVALV
jgi:hypothetical protein